MFRYPSNITFLYYKDLSYGTRFMTDVLQLSMIMDQGFAKIYQVNQTSYIGIVQQKKEQNQPGDTLISLNTNDLEKEYQRMKNKKVKDMTYITVFSDIPLHSFFFQDEEGHRFEIQRFDREIDRLEFGVQ